MSDALPNPSLINWRLERLETTVSTVEGKVDDIGDDLRTYRTEHAERYRRDREREQGKAANIRVYVGAAVTLATLAQGVLIKFLGG